MKYLCLVYLEEAKLHAVPDTECAACGHKRLNTLFTPEQLKDMYTRYYPRAMYDPEKHKPHGETTRLRYCASSCPKESGSSPSRMLLLRWPLRKEKFTAAAKQVSLAVHADLRGMKRKRYDTVTHAHRRAWLSFLLV